MSPTLFGILFLGVVILLLVLGFRMGEKITKDADAKMYFKELLPIMKSLGFEPHAEEGMLLFFKEENDNTFLVMTENGLLKIGIVIPYDPSKVRTSLLFNLGEHGFNNGESIGVTPYFIFNQFESWKYEDVPLLVRKSIGELSKAEKVKSMPFSEYLNKMRK